MGHNSRLGILMLGTLALLSCRGEATVITVGSPDGVLDCGRGEIPRAADASGSGDTEREAVENALVTWLDDGARLANPTDAEVWSAVVDGNEVAIGAPEREGDGGWVVAHVQVCGQPDTGPAEIDGSLDCAGEMVWTEQADFDVDAQGEDTAEQAVRLDLDRHRERYGGEVVMIDENTGSLVVDDREQVMAFATEAPAGGWLVATTMGCGEVAG